MKMELIDKKKAIEISEDYCHWTNISQELEKLPPIIAIPIEEIQSLINDIEVLRTCPAYIDDDNLQDFVENGVLFALRNLLKQ